jgi:hypothetical protein
VHRVNVVTALGGLCARGHEPELQPPQQESVKTSEEFNRLLMRVTSSKRSSVKANGLTSFLSNRSDPRSAGEDRWTVPRQALIEEWTLMGADPIADPMTSSPMAPRGLTDPWVFVFCSPRGARDERSGGGSRLLFQVLVSPIWNQDGLGSETRCAQNDTLRAATGLAAAPLSLDDGYSDFRFRFRISVRGFQIGFRFKERQ